MVYEVSFVYSVDQPAGDTGNSSFCYNISVLQMVNQNAYIPMR